MRNNFNNLNDSSNLKTFYQLKLILLGDSGVGKSSLLHRYMDKPFNPDIKCTINTDMKIKSFNIDSSTSAQITIWDTCGQEKYRSLTNNFFRDAHGIILMYDVCDRRSFNSLDGWLNEINKHTFKEDVSIILCGNKTDLKFRKTSFEEGYNFSKNNDILFCETSSKDGYNVNTVFENLTYNIIEKKKKKHLFEEEIKNNSTSLTSSTKAVRGKESKREKEIKCC